LALKADVRFETVALPHLDSEKMIVPLSFPAGCVLGKKLLVHLEIAERMWWQEVKQIKTTLFRVKGKVRRHMIGSLQN